MFLVNQIERIYVWNLIRKRLNRWRILVRAPSCNIAIIIKAKQHNTTQWQWRFISREQLSTMKLINYSWLPTYIHTYTHGSEAHTRIYWQCFRYFLLESSNKKKKKRRKEALKIAWRHQFLNFFSRIKHTHTCWMRIEWLLLDQ